MQTLNDVQVLSVSAKAHFSLPLIELRENNTGLL